MNNKSRPEYPITLNDFKSQQTKRRGSTKICTQDNNNNNNLRKKKPKGLSKKKSLSKPKQNKYVPGEFIYDTKGQMAEIKYIGQVMITNVYITYFTLISREIYTKTFQKNKCYPFV